MNDLSKREKSIVCGLFLSKFDTKGIAALGFNSFKEAFNVFGSAIQVKPASIKNYRDEFDPFFPNGRKGWHKRNIRKHCERIFETYQSFDLEEMLQLIFSITNCKLNTALESEESTEAFSKRLLTGLAAENFFRSNYKVEPEFQESAVEDVTLLGCGFDFKLKYLGKRPFEAIEVKGISDDRGSILLTKKEYSVANLLGNRYFLYVVKNFEEQPYAVKFRNPLLSKLSFRKTERIITEVSWNAKI